MPWNDELEIDVDEIGPVTVNIIAAAGFEVEITEIEPFVEG